MSIHVLVVDDDVDVRESLVEVLQDEGFTVTSAEGGNAALAVLRSRPWPDAILLDWMMPRCDGATFLVEKRKLERAMSAAAAIPVVVLSAYVGVQPDDACVTAVVRKPVALPDLIDVVCRCAQVGSSSSYG